MPQDRALFLLKQDIEELLIRLYCLISQKRHRVDIAHDFIGVFLHLAEFFHERTNVVLMRDADRAFSEHRKIHELHLGHARGRIGRQLTFLVGTQVDHRTQLVFIDEHMDIVIGELLELVGTNELS